MREDRIVIVVNAAEGAVIRWAAGSLGKSASGWGREVLFEAARAVLEASPAWEQENHHAK